jgi:hypothetical protein
MLSSGLLFGARVATGSSNPTSGNVSFGDLFGKKSVGLDRVFLAYQPLEQLTVIAGKMENPFLDRELLWDGDVAPEGLVQIATIAVGERLQLGGAFGELVLGDLDETVRDPWVFVGQLEASIAAAPTIELTVGVAYYHYANLDSAPLPYAHGTNSHDGEGILTEEFHIPVLLLAATIRTGWMPLAVHVEISRNVAAESDEDGAQFELRLGTHKRAGDWSVGYVFQRLERDATPDALAESHWHSQRTNYDGHALNGKLAVRDGWILSSSLKLMHSLDGPKADETRITVDMIAEL